MSDQSTPDLPVRYVAELAQLELTESEAEEMQTQLERVLAYVDTLNELEVEELPPLSHPLEMANRTRPDEVNTGLATETVMDLAPASRQQMFLVPRIIE